MALSFVSSTGWASSATTVSPGLPTGTVVDDWVVITLVSKYDDAVLPSAPAGWTEIGSAAVNTGSTAGNDAGNMRCRAFIRQWQTGDSMPTFAPSPNNVSVAKATTYRVAAGMAVGFAGGPVAANQTATPWILATGSTLGLTSGDTLHADIVANGDVITWGTSTPSATGATFGAMATNNPDASTITGTDLEMRSVRWPVSSGTATGNAQISQAVTGGTTATRVIGLVVRLREITPPPDNWTVSATDVMGLSDSATVQLTNANALDILVVVDDVGPTVDDTNFMTMLTDKGHTVTQGSELNALPDTGYDVIVVTESGSASSAAVASIPTCLLPVVLFETAWNTARLSTTAMVTNGSGTQYDLQTHAINTGHPDPLTIFSSSASFYGVPTTDLASGVAVVAVAAGVTTHATCVAADTGATLTSGTAPNRRVAIGLVTTRLTGASSLAPDWLEDAIIWAANVSTGPDNWTVSQSDSAGLADSAALSQGHVHNPTDSAGLSDNATVSFVLSQSATDSLQLSDASTVSEGHGSRPSDAAGLGDAATLSQDHVVRPTDQSGLVDSASVRLTIPVGATDQLGLNDSAVVALFRNIPISATDSMPLSDAATLRMEHVVTVKDSMGLSDTTQVAQGHGRSTADSVGLADSAVVSRGLGSTSVDSLGISDIASIAQGHAHSVFDGMGLSDAATVQLSAVISVLLQSTMGLSDSATVVVFSLLSQNSTDVMPLADTVRLAVGHGLSVKDGMGLVDTVKPALSAQIAVADTLALVDAATFNLAMPITVGDILGLSDATQVVLIEPQRVAIWDPMPLSDTVDVRLITAFVPATDAEAGWASGASTARQPKGGGSAAVIVDANAAAAHVPGKGTASI